MRKLYSPHLLFFSLMILFSYILFFFFLSFSLMIFLRTLLLYIAILSYDAFEKTLFDFRNYESEKLL